MLNRSLLRSVHVARYSSPSSLLLYEISLNQHTVWIPPSADCGCSEWLWIINGLWPHSATLTGFTAKKTDTEDLYQTASYHDFWGTFAFTGKDNCREQPFGTWVTWSTPEGQSSFIYCTYSNLLSIPYFIIYSNIFTLCTTNMLCCCQHCLLSIYTLTSSYVYTYLLNKADPTFQA